MTESESLSDDEIAEARARADDVIADETEEADVPTVPDDAVRRQRLMDEAVAELRASGRISVR